MLRQAAVQALRPEFHLRADKFYNAPDTEMDFTEQGGLMWQTTAVGKLIAGPEAMRPQVEPFVDEDAGVEVAEKVRRRLQHFIDRRVAAQFEPLLAMSRDEALTGLARGFAFRLVESLGVLPRDQVGEDVKALDQESRAVLRKHGVRFGQFTVFLPLLLKPAPTRLRLVLWSLFNGLQEFPESPPPGLVTIPNLPDVPKGHYTLAGYHPAGARAIRIDMLERLADLLRAKDSRAGFEAMPEMLSITGMTLEQFSGLMIGLGYKAEKGERPKVKADLPVSVQPVPEGESVLAPELVAPAVVELGTAEPEGPEAGAAEAGIEAAVAPVEMEAFYTFTWAPKPRQDQRPPRPARPERQSRPPRPVTKTVMIADEVPAAAAPAAAPSEPRQDRREGYKGKPKPDFKAKGGDQPDRGGKDRPDRKDQGPRRDQGGDRKDRPDRNDQRKDQPKTFEARPPRVEKIDPDNPFAVLAALRNRT